MKKLLLAALCCAALATTAMAQTQAKPKKAAPVVIAPDTLGDLKAEFEYQEQQLAPYLKLYEDAKEKRMACVHSIFDSPVGHPGCHVQERDIIRVGQMAEATAVKYTAAKDAYEREQRKANRSK